MRWRVRGKVLEKGVAVMVRDRERMRRKGVRMRGRIRGKVGEKSRLGWKKKRRGWEGCYG